MMIGFINYSPLFFQEKLDLPEWIYDDTRFTILDDPKLDGKISIDQRMSEYLSARELVNKNLTALFIPVSLGLDYTNFLGIRLGLHIRLSQIEGLDARIPLIFMGGETEAEICRVNPIGHFLFTAGVRLIPETQSAIESALDTLPAAVTHEYIQQDLIHLVRPETPEFYDNRHGIANEWGLLYLDAFTGHRILQQEPKLKEIQSNLYIKWLLAQSGIRRFGPQSALEPFVLENVKGKKVLVIDDEWNKGWGNLFKAFFRNGQEEGATVDVLEIEKNDQPPDIFNKLKKKLEKASYDLFILDLRLTDGDHGGSMRHDELTGMQVLQFIKEDNAGHQVIVVSASNKFLVYNYAQQILKANEVLIKPDLGAWEQGEAFLENLQDAVTRCMERGILKVIWKKIQEIHNGVRKAQFVEGMEPGDEKAVFKFADQAEIALTECWFHLTAPEQNVHLPYALLSLARLIELYSKQRFVSKTEKSSKKEDQDTLVIMSRDGEEQVVWRDSKQVKGNAETLFEWEKINFQTRKEVGKGPLFLLIRKDEFYDFHPRSKRLEVSDFVIRQCVLIFRHGYNESTLRRYLELSELRNTQVAHISKTGQKDKSSVAIHDVEHMLEIVRGCMLFVSEENLKL